MTLAREIPSLAAILARLSVVSFSNSWRQIRANSNGCGCKTTADAPPVELLYSESFPDRESAARREQQIKGWSRAKKLALVNGDLGRLKELAQCRSGSNGPCSERRPKAGVDARAQVEGPYAPPANG